MFSWMIDRAEYALVFALFCLACKLVDNGTLKKICTRKEGNAEIFHERLMVVLFIAIVVVPPLIVSLIPAIPRAVLSFSFSFFVIGYLVSSWVHKNQ